MKESYYFSHDYNARNDEKIIKLIAKNGWEAYGLFWAIIEMLYEANGFLENDPENIAFALRTDSDRITTILNSGLFHFSSKKFYSKSVCARLERRKGKSEQARQAAVLRWDKPKKDHATAMRPHSDRNAIKERKGKERKEKDIITSEQEISAPTAPGTKKIFELFYQINPTINFGNKTYRKAAEDLIKQFGEEKAVEAAMAAVEAFGKPYSPTITNPYLLKTKLSDLFAYYSKEQGKGIQTV